MRERCTVSLKLVGEPGIGLDEITALVGTEPNDVRRDPQESHVWELTFSGRSPVNAPRVANGLARRLLTHVGAATRSPETWTRMRGVHDREVRFQFHFGTLLNFSYAFDPDVVRRLSNLGARISFHHDDSCDAPTYRFGSGPSPDERCQVRLRLSGESLDPDVATTIVGIQPSTTRRTSSRNYWLLDGPSTHDVNQAIAETLGRLPTSSDGWTRLSHDCAVEVMVAFQVRQMSGSFDLDSATMHRLADCNCGLDASFYDYGPNGADLIR